MQPELRTGAQNLELFTVNCTRASGGSCKPSRPQQPAKQK